VGGYGEEERNWNEPVRAAGEIRFVARSRQTQDQILLYRRQHFSMPLDHP